MFQSHLDLEVFILVSAVIEAPSNSTEKGAEFLGCCTSEDKKEKEQGLKGGEPDN